MNIKSRFKDYQVNLVSDFSFIDNITLDEKTYVVADKNVYKLYYDRLFKRISKEQLYLIEAVEENKTIKTALEICEKMTGLSARRNARLVSVGGGIIQDITGFVANILYRGIHWTFVPTTLLASCDSCIGGKTSLNYKSFKNLLGTFYPPDEIYICPVFFDTLSEKDFLSGLGEVVKFNFMYGEEGLVKIEENISKLIDRDKEVLNQFVESSLLFKRRFIEEDEFDRGKRIQLNFAHTFGHAFETMSNYEIPHGTAVAMGTVTANYISMKRGMLDEEYVQRMENVLWNIIRVNITGLHINIDTILKAIHKDKKQVDNQITAILMDRKMELHILHDLQSEEIANAVKYLFGHLKGNDN
ncbi:iron-containing alcohol dehydrogenase [bacterium 1xD8-48]|nr:iron-containing alcohol dehydrogenase [bacterium 1xD8-48]